MNLSTVYCRTSKGARALSLKNKVLPPSHIQVLTKTDGKLDAKSVMQAIGKLTEYQYTQILIQLINDGFVIAKSDFDETAFFTSNTVNPMVVEELQTKQFFDTSFGSAITRSASTTPVATFNKQEQARQGKARAQAELDAEADNIAEVKAAIEAKLKIEAEAEARAKAEAEAQAKAEAEARAKAEAEAQAKAEAEARAKAEAEARAKAEAEAQAKAEAEARAKAEAEAQAKAEAEARAKAEAEAQAKAETEARAKEKAEAEAQAKAETEARAKAEAEAQAKAEAEARAKAKAKAEAQAKAEAEARAKAKAEAQAKAETEARAKEKAEAEAQAKAETEARAKAKAEAQAKAEAEARAKAKAEAEAQAKAEAEARAKAKAEAQAKAEAEARAKAKAEAEAQAKAEAEAKIAAILTKHQHKQPKQVKQHIEIDESAFGDTFSAIDEHDDRRHSSNQEAMEDESTPNIFQNIAASIQQKSLSTKPKRQFSLLKIVGFTLHYLVTFVTHWLTPIVLGLAGLAVVLVLLSHIPMVMSPFIGQMEKIAGEHIGERVKIHKLRTSLLPPRLILDQVNVGNMSEIEIKSVSMFVNWDSLSTPISQIELVGMNVTPSQVKRMTGWVSHSQTQTPLQVARIQMRDITIQLNQAKLPTFNATVIFNPLNRVETADIKLVEQDATATLTAQDDAYSVLVQAKRLVMPLGAPVLIQTLKAEGFANGQTMTIDRMQGNLYGGTFEGSAIMGWSNNWNITGKLNIKDAGLDGLAPNFGTIQAKGNLATEINFAAVSANIERIFDRPTIKARFTVEQGDVSWIDIIRAIQVAKKGMAINGPTNFDQLSGQLTVKNGQYAYEQLVLKSGNLRATGAFTIQENQQLKGNIRVNLSTPNRKVKSTLQLAGSTSQPQTK
ncbi:MAG: AsmA-like C-terminal region-containing protein [Methylophilus sp.]|nr:AsmA-like C-terminal region-containing protein [Methylophilus sp.]